MNLAQHHALGIVIAIQVAIAVSSFALSAREISRNPSVNPEGAVDGYMLIVSITSGLLAFFGMWAVAEIGEKLGVDVHLGGHNAPGVFLMAFFGAAVIGTFLAIFGKAALLDLSSRRRPKQ